MERVRQYDELCHHLQEHEHERVSESESNKLAIAYRPSAVYASQAHTQQRFTMSEVVAGWQCIMRPTVR